MEESGRPRDPHKVETVGSNPTSATILAKPTLLISHSDFLRYGMNITIAFQKRPATLWCKLICWWTKGPYFHTATWFDDKTFVEAIGTGVHRIKVSGLDPEHWDTIKIPITQEQFIKLNKWIDTELGCGYDWIGMICSQGLGWHFRSENKWYCSEFTIAMLQQIGMLVGKDPCEIDPNELFKLLKK